MREIRLWFSQSDPNFGDLYFVSVFERKYRVVIDPHDPEYVIVGTCGLGPGQRSHFDYPNAVKIFYTGENTIPDFNLFDYALGFHYIDFADRYMRYPLWLLYLNRIGRQEPEPTTDGSAKHFCNFVYSNNIHSDPIRSEVLDLIESYQPVDSGGSFRNTLGHRVGDKLAFIRQYLFTIAVENSAAPGYTTEKLLEPSLAGTMPIYWGDPLVDRDFNTERFVWIRSKSSDHMQAALDEVKYLHAHPQAYAEKMSLPIFRNHKTLALWEEELLTFFSHIFDQPHATAFRRVEYGFNRHLTLQKRRAATLAQNRYYNLAFGLIERLTNQRQKPTQNKKK